MSTTNTRKRVSSGDYEKALAAGRAVGAGVATDAQVMALFCENSLQGMVGAFSPRRVWEGAQKAGLTAVQLHELCHRKKYRALDDLQFS